MKQVGEPEYLLQALEKYAIEKDILLDDLYGKIYNMKIEYRTSPVNMGYLTPMWLDWRQLVQIYEDKMIWSRQVKKTIIKKPKEKIEEKLYYNESFVKWCCSYYKDIEEKYNDWRQQRKECGKFKPYTERNEKVTFNKLSKFPKPIAEEMLDKAIAWSWGRLIELESYEVEKIMKPLRQKKHKEEQEREGFATDEQKQQAELERQKIQDYIKQNPSIREQARLFVEEKHSSLQWKYKDSMITAKMAKIAKDLLNK